LKPKVGDLVTDSQNRIGVVVEIFKSELGNYYSVLIEGEVHHLSEEDIKQKNG